MSLFKSHTKLSDEALMKRLQNQKIKAFDELYARYHNKLYGFALKMLKYSRQSADDSIQEVFIKLYQYPEKFDVSKKFKSWIYTVTANECRKKLRIKELESIDSSELNSQENIIKTESELSEFMKQLNSQLENVSTSHKEAFILKHQAGFSLQEIAEIQECALGTVKSRLHYTTKFLAEKLHEQRALLQ